jgi:hypothetical protein
MVRIGDHERPVRSERVHVQVRRVILAAGHDTRGPALLAIAGDCGSRGERRLGVARQQAVVAGRKHPVHDGVVRFDDADGGAAGQLVDAVHASAPRGRQHRAVGAHAAGARPHGQRKGPRRVPLRPSGPHVVERDDPRRDANQLAGGRPARGPAERVGVEHAQPPARTVDEDGGGMAVQEQERAVRAKRQDPLVPGIEYAVRRRRTRCRLDPAHRALGDVDQREGQVLRGHGGEASVRGEADRRNRRRRGVTRQHPPLGEVPQDSAVAATGHQPRAGGGHAVQGPQPEKLRSGASRGRVRGRSPRHVRRCATFLAWEVALRGRSPRHVRRCATFLAWEVALRGRSPRHLRRCATFLAWEVALRGRSPRHVRRCATSLPPEVAL